MMAKKEMDQIYANMRDRVAFANDYKETRERRLKQLNSSREAQKMYDNGKKYAHDGFKLEDSENASDIHFQRGFQAAYKEKGFNYGYKAYKEEDVPSEYLENKYFLDGYKKGILQLEKETYKRSSSRR